MSWPCSRLCCSVHVYLYSEECCLPALASSLFSSPVVQDCSHLFASQAPWRLLINAKWGDKDIIKRCVCFKTDIEKYLICSHQASGSKHPPSSTGQRKFTIIPHFLSHAFSEVSPDGKPVANTLSPLSYFSPHHFHHWYIISDLY